MLVRIFILCILNLLYIHIQSQAEIKLNSPIVDIQGGLVIPGEQLTISAEFRLEGSSIRYTTDGTEPNATSKKYNYPIAITTPSLLKFRTYHPSFLPSETATYNLITSGINYDDISVSPAANPKYADNGDVILMDKQLGSTEYNNGYLGFNSGPISIHITNHKKKRIRGVIVSYIVNQGAWIFAPTSVRVRRQKKSVTLKTEEQSTGKNTITLHLKKKKRKSLTIEIQPIRRLPEWHPGKGSPGWLFIDEVIVY